MMQHATTGAWKRLLSLALAFVMAASLLPASALAEADGALAPEPTETAGGAAPTVEPTPEAVLPSPTEGGAQGGAEGGSEGAGVLPSPGEGDVNGLGIQGRDIDLGTNSNVLKSSPAAKLPAGDASAQLANAPELVSNGAFAGMSQVAVSGGWTAVGTSDGATLETNAPGVYGTSGFTTAQVLEINGGGGGYPHTVYTQLAETVPGRQYLLTFQYARRGSGGSGDDSMFVTLPNAGTQQPLTYATLRSDAHFGTGDITPSSAAAQTYAYVFTPNTAGQYWLAFNAATPASGGMGNIIGEVSLRALALPHVYVSSTGSDTAGTGAQDAPFATLAMAYKYVQENGTIHVVGEVSVTSSDNSGLFIGDTARKNITLTGDGTGKLLRGNNSHSPIQLQANAGGTLTLQNITLDGNGAGAGKNADTPFVYVWGGGNTLNIGEGTVIENVSNTNSTATLAGGAVTVVAGGTVNMTGGALRNNAAVAGGGVNVYGGTLNLRGGEISGNAATNHGGGVCVNNNGQLAVEGSPKVTGNTTTSTSSGNHKSNVSMYSGALTLSGPLSDGADIGVYAGAYAAPVLGAQFATAAATGYANADKLVSDVTDRVVGAYGAGTAIVWANATQQDVYVKGDGLDTNPGTQASPFKTLKMAYDSVKAGGTIHVIGQVPQPAAANITVTKNVNIVNEGAGAGFVRQSGNAEAFITLTGGALSITGVALDGSKASVAATQALINMTGGELTLNSGAILQNNNAGVNYGGDRAGGLRVAGGKATLNAGASITGNTCNYGTGATVRGGALFIKGGTITNNDATNGGAGYGGAGVYLWGGTLDISSGSIAGNRTVGKDSTACNGLAPNAGPDVNYDTGTLSLSGTAQIGCVYLQRASNKMTVGSLGSGASIGVSTQATAVGSVISAGGAASIGYFKYLNGNGLSIVPSGDNLALGYPMAVYVKSDGSDATGAGTQAAPFATLAKAYSAMQDGGTIYVMDTVAVAGGNASTGLVLTSGKKHVTLTGQYTDASGATHTDGKLLRASNYNSPIQIQTNAGGTLTLQNITLDGNGSGVGKDANTPFVYIWNGNNTLNIGEGTVIEHVSSTATVASLVGGAVTVCSGSTVNMTGGALRNNAATYGGGVNVYGGTFNLTGGEISGNTATNQGGGVYMSSGTFKLTGGTIGGNKSATQGGGLYMSSGLFAMNGGTVSGNATTGNYSGGGVFISNGTANLAAGSITGNTTKGGGGGVCFANGGAVNVGGSMQITGNTTTKNGSAADNLYLGANKLVSLTLAPNGMKIGITHAAAPVNGTKFGVANGAGYSLAGFTLDDSGLSNYEAAYQGANNLVWQLKAQQEVYVKSNGLDTNDGTQNKPFKTLSTAYANVKAGGTIHVMDRVPMLAANAIVVTKNITISGSGFNGAALVRQSGNAARLITVRAGSSVTLQGVTLDGNNIRQDISSRSGGQLAYVNGGTLTVDSGSVLQNNIINHTYTDYGSAIYVDGNGTVNISGAIKNNTLTGSYSDGAAISSISGSNTINLLAGGSITGNTAGRIGSAIRLSSGTLSIAGSITGNSASPYGAVAFLGGTVKIADGGSVTGNLGRNLYLNSGMTLTVEGALSGTAKVGVTTANASVGAQVTTGGGSYGDYFSYDPGGLRVSQGAGGSQAGTNLYLALETDYYVSASGNDGTGNGTKASPYLTLAKAYAMLPSAGGAIHVVGQVAQPASANITANKQFDIVGESGAKLLRQSGNTGAFITQAGGALSITGVALDGNKASVAAAQALISVTGGELTLGSGAILQNNNPGVNYGGDRAGGLRVAGGKATLNSGASITGNTCNYGTGVTVRGGALVIAGGSITDNDATSGGSGYGGGGVFVWGGSLEMTSGSITGNRSAGKDSTQCNGLAPNEGPDVNLYSGTLKLSGGSQIGGLYLAGGNTAQVDTSFSGSVGVAVNKAPAAGTVRRLSSNNGHAGSVPGTWASLAHQGAITTEGGYIVLSGKSSDATLDYVDRNALMGETATYPAVSGGAKGDGVECAQEMVVTVPFAQGPKNFYISAYATNSGAKIVTSLASGTDASKVAVSTRNGVNTTVKYNPDSLDAGATFASYTYTVTAEDGKATKAYTVTIKRGLLDASALPAELNLSVNFDTTDKANPTSYKDAMAYIDLPIQSSDAAEFTLSDSAGSAGTNYTGISLSRASDAPYAGKLQVNVGTAYEAQLPEKKIGQDGWVNSSVSGKYELAEHVKALYLWYNGVKLCKVNLHTTVVSVSEAAVVDGVVDAFNAPGAYQDMYQKLADVAAADSKQAIDVQAQADAETVMAAYAAQIGADALQTAYSGSGGTASLEVWAGDRKIKTESVSVGSDGGGKKLVIDLAQIAFAAPVAGGQADTDGADGLYKFQAVVTLGKQSTTNEQSVPIHAHGFGGISAEDLRKALLGDPEGTGGPFYNADGTAQLADTVYVDADATPADILAAVEAKMQGAVAGKVTGLHGGGVTYAVQGSIAFAADGLADGNYTASLTVQATKAGESSSVAITVPLKMTVVYRPAVDDLVAKAIEKAINDALAAGSLSINDVADNDAGDYRMAAKLQAYAQKALQDGLDAIQTVEVNTAAPGEAANNVTITLASAGYSLSAGASGRFTAPVPGTAAAAPGIDGQYVFSATISIKKGGAEVGSFAPGLAETSNPVKKVGATDPGSKTDNGVYITACPYAGVSDGEAASIIAYLLSDAPAKIALPYDQRNDAPTRLAKVQEWAEGVINSATSVTVNNGSTNVSYTLAGGRVTGKSGQALPANQQNDLGLAAITAAISGPMASFTSPSTAASAADVTNDYTLTASMGASGLNLTKTVSFSHAAGAVKGAVTGGEGPYTITLIGPDGATHVITTAPDGSYEIPPEITGSGFTMLVQDKNNANSAISGPLDLPAAAQTQPLISLSSGSALRGTVSVKSTGKPLSGAQVSAPKEGGGRATATALADGSYAMANVKMGIVDVSATKTEGSVNYSGLTSRQNVPMDSHVDVQVLAGLLVKSAGKVTLPDGVTPAAGAKVTLTGPDGQVYTGTVDSEGYIAVPGVPDALLTGFTVSITDSLGRTNTVKDRTITNNGGGTGTLDLGADPFVISPSQADVGSILGTLDGDLIEGAKLELYYDNVLCGTEISDAHGKFEFKDLPYGVYKLVVTRQQGEFTKVVNTFNLALAAPVLKQTLVLPTLLPIKLTEVQSAGSLGQVTAQIPFENFTAVGDGTQGFTQAELDQAKNTSGGSLELLLRASALPEPAGQPILSAAPQNSRLAMVMDLSLFKIINGGSPIGLTGCGTPIDLLVAVPEEYQNMTDRLSVWYTHGGVSQFHSADFSTVVGGKRYCRIAANAFSTYALVYTEPSTGGGGGTAGAYAVTFPQMPVGYTCSYGVGTYYIGAGKLNFTITAAKGYSLKDLVVMANGVVIKPNLWGQYTIDVQRNVVITLGSPKLVPKTGDNMAPGLHLGLMCLLLAAAGAGSAYLWRRRKDFEK